MNRNERCRDLSKCVRNGEPIKHTIKSSDRVESKTWIMTYDMENNVLVCGDITYPGLNPFTVTNYKKFRPDRGPGNNAWSECKIYRDNQWISMYDLPEL